MKPFLKGSVRSRCLMKGKGMAAMKQATAWDCRRGTDPWRQVVPGREDWDSPAHSGAGSLCTGGTLSPDPCLAIYQRLTAETEQNADSLTQSTILQCHKLVNALLEAFWE